MSKIFSIILVCAILSMCTVGVACGVDINDTGGRCARYTHEAFIYDNGDAYIDGVYYENCALQTEVVYDRYNPEDRIFSIVKNGTIHAIEKGCGLVEREVFPPDLKRWHVQW